MYRFDGANTSTTPPVMPAAQTEAFPQTGVPGSTSPTVPGPWWFYMIVEELRNIVIWAGLTPNKADTTQVAQAVSQTAKRVVSAMANGTSTWTVPNGVYRVQLTCVGAGGAGGGTNGSYGGAGGGAGGCAIKYLPVTPGDVLTIVVGAGLAGLAAGVTGVPSGSTSIAQNGTIVCEATGGYGADYNSTSSTGGGAGGAGSIGDILLKGGCGQDGQATTITMAGNGGASFFGGGGKGCANTSSAGINGQAPGSGAGGLYTVAGSGGQGADGAALIEY